MVWAAALGAAATVASKYVGAKGDDGLAPGATQVSGAPITNENIGNFNPPEFFPAAMAGYNPPSGVNALGEKIAVGVAVAAVVGLGAVLLKKRKG